MPRKAAAVRVRLNARAFWDRLERANLSQNELARRIGVTSGYLSQLISGRRSPSPRTRRCLLEALDVGGFDELFIVEVGRGTR